MSDTGRMTAKAIVEEILRLPPAERVHIIREVWDSVADRYEDLIDGDLLPIPQWQLDLLEEDLRNPSPEPPMSWDELKERLLRKVKP